MRSKIAITLLVLILSLPAAAMAHPFDLFGTGPRAVAMGGAYGAIGNDIAGLYYNVACIANVERMQIEFGYLVGDPSLSINGRDLDVDNNQGTNFGGIVSQVIKNHRFSVGANIYIPDHHVLRFLVLPSRNPRYTMYTNRNHALIALVGGALEVFDWWNIGAGASFLGDNFGGVDFVISETSPSAGSLESEIGSLFSPIAGMWFQVTDWLNLGISYREKIQVYLDLPNTISIPEVYAFTDSGIPILSESFLYLLATSFSHFSPRQFQLGSAWNLHERILLGFDLTYYQWSEFDNPTPKTVIELSGGLGDLFPVGPSDPIPDPKFKDVIVPAIGLEGRAVDLDRFQLDLRAGYYYRRSPVPDQEGLTNFVDSNTHVVSTGLGLTGSDLTGIFPRPVSLDIYFQSHLLEPRNVEKAQPNEPSGDYRMSGFVLCGGANFVLRF